MRSLVQTLGLISRATANRPAHAILRGLVTGAHALMGIGTGRFGLSGEAISIQRCRPGAVIFDVGANTGQFARLVNANLNDCQLYCFEPGRAAFEALRENIKSASLFNVALGEQPGVMTLHYDRPGSRLACLTKRKLDHHGIDQAMREEVSVDTVDLVCERCNIQRIDLLKIDVEGFELQVLRGASNKFSQRAIKAVQFEFGGCNIDSRTFFQDFFYFFRSHGMRIHRITPSGYLHPIDRYNESLEQFRTTNYLVF